MKVNDHICHGGPHDGCRVTHGSNIPAMPGTVYLQRKPNEDGFQPWSMKPSKRFPAIYKRPDNDWGFYNFSGWSEIPEPRTP